MPARASKKSKNMKLLAQHELGGFGNVGEGMAIQLARNQQPLLIPDHHQAGPTTH